MQNVETQQTDVGGLLDELTANIRKENVGVKKEITSINKEIDLKTDKMSEF